MKKSPPVDPYPELNGDDMVRILADIGTETPIAKSRVKYNDDAKRFRADVEKEWAAYREKHPKAILDIPNEAAAPDIPVLKPPPPKQGKGARANARSGG